MSQKPFPIKRSRPIKVGESTNPGSAGVIVSCSAEGWVRLRTETGGFVEIYALPGSYAFPDINVAGVETNAAFTPLATNVVVNVCDY